MTTEEARNHADAIHKMATEILTSFHQQRNLHPPLVEILPMFAEQMTRLAAGALPNSQLEAAKVLYLTTLISFHTVDEVAAAYIQLAADNDATTVAE